jgi:hypothetical protein
MESRVRVVMTAVLVSAAASLAGACGSSSPTTPGAPTVGGEGSAGRVGWIQPAASLAQANGYSYKSYVDTTTRVDLGSQTCRQGATNTSFDCSAALPQLSQGRHVLELIAVDGGGMESPRAAPLVVVVTATGISLRSE